MNRILVHRNLQHGKKIFSFNTANCELNNNTRKRKLHKNASGLPIIPLRKFSVFTIEIFLILFLENNIFGRSYQNSRERHIKWYMLL